MERAKRWNVWNRAASLTLALAIVLIPAHGLAASGCTYPSTLDTFTDKVAADSLTVANVNTISCAIEKAQAELALA